MSAEVLMATPCTNSLIQNLPSSISSHVARVTVDLHRPKPPWGRKLPQTEGLRGVSVDGVSKCAAEGAAARVRGVSAGSRFCAFPENLEEWLEVRDPARAHAQQPWRSCPCCLPRWDAMARLR